MLIWYAKLWRNYTCYIWSQALFKLFGLKVQEWEKKISESHILYQNQGYHKKHKATGFLSHTEVFKVEVESCSIYSLF